MPPVTESTPIQFSDALPEAADVVVIGGGIIGVCTAWHLAKAGQKVVLCEKGRIAGEQSSRNWGWVRVTGRDETEIPLLLASQPIWQGLSELFGERVGYTSTGMVTLAETEKDAEKYDSWLKLAEQYGIDSELLSSKQIQKRFPYLADQWHSGISTASDARAEPFTAVPAMAEYAQSLGVKVIEQCAVLGVDTQAGAVSSVRTEKGSIKTSSVVCAGGAWSKLFLSSLGIYLPQLSVSSSVARTAPCSEISEGNIGLKDVYVRRRVDGSYTVASGMAQHLIGPDSFRSLKAYLPSMNSRADIQVRLGSDPTQQRVFRTRQFKQGESPFEQHRVLEPTVSKADMSATRRNLLKRVPAFQDVEFAETWVGMIDVLPDVVPVIDYAPNYEGLVIATGFSGHGFGIGPAAGQAIAELALGKTPSFDLSRFRYQRFIDGTRLLPGPTL